MKMVFTTKYYILQLELVTVLLLLTFGTTKYLITIIKMSILLYLYKYNTRVVGRVHIKCNIIVMLLV